MSTNAQPTNNKTASDDWGFDIFSAAELARKEYAPIRFLVEDVLPPGLAILSAPPKSGKSWLALYLSLCVADGAPFLGFKTNQCSTIYAGLEDSFQRLQARLVRLWGDHPPDNCHIVTQAHHIGDRLPDSIRAMKRRYPDLGLVVLDLFERVRNIEAGSSNAYRSDYGEAATLKRIADELGICILAVMHNRKMRDETDVFNNISGTTGIFGAADTGMILQKERREDKQAQLHISGKDVEMQSIRIEQDEHLRWIRADVTLEELESREKAAFMGHPLTKTVRELLNESESRFLEVSASELFEQMGRRFGGYGDLTTTTITRYIRDNKDRFLKLGIKPDFKRRSQGNGWVFERTNEKEE